MTQYAVLHVSKGKGPSSGLTAHNERTKTPDNADPKLSHLNIIEDFTAMGRTLEDRANYVIQEAQVERKVQADAVLYCPIILSGSHDTMKQILEDGELEAWNKDNRKWIEGRFGKENIISWAVHADEPGGAHVHVSVVPIIKSTNKKGKEVTRLSAKDVFNPLELKKLQTDYAQAMSKWGLERGMDSSITRVKHQDTKAFYRDLPEKIEKLNEVIEDKKEQVKDLKKDIRIDSAWKTVTGVIDAIGKKKQIDQKEARISILNTKVVELDEELKNVKLEASDLKKEKQRLDFDNRELRKENKGLHNTVKELTAELKSIMISSMKTIMDQVKKFMIKDNLPVYYEYSEAEEKVIRVNVEDKKKQEAEALKQSQNNTKLTPTSKDNQIDLPDNQPKKNRGMSM